MGEERTVSTINVRKLISVYENRSEFNDVPYYRQRAKSWGNILADDIVVKYNEYYTLQDIQTALDKVETNLNYYQVYDKQKHVTFQEQLFNILTWVVNIEIESDDDPKKKKDLIGKTQTLVSVLNQKLPNLRSNNKISHHKPETQQAETNEHVEEEVLENSEVPSSTTLKDGTEYSISIRKLKETFQTKEEAEKRTEIKQVSKDIKSEKRPIKKSSNKEPVPIKQETSVAQPIQNTDITETFEEPDSSKQIPVEKVEEIQLEEPNIPKIVSVTKLRDLFEQKSKEESAGLQAILDAPRTFQYEVKIPYTEGNLGKYRLYRANSGYYVNQPGLLKKVDITRSKSMNTFDYGKYVAYKDRNRNKIDNKDDSGEGSDTSTDSVESVKEANINRSSAVQVPLGQVESASRTIDAENDSEFKSAEVIETPNSNFGRIQLSQGTVEDEEIKYFSTATVEMKKPEVLTKETEEVLINDNINLEENENKPIVAEDITVLDDPKQLQSDIVMPEKEIDIKFSEAKPLELGSSVSTSTISDEVKEVPVTYATATSVESSSGEIETSTNTVNGEVTPSVETKVEEVNHISNSNDVKTVTGDKQAVTNTVAPDASIHSISEMSLDEETLRKAEEEFDSLIEINEIA